MAVGCLWSAPVAGLVIVLSSECDGSCKLSRLHIAARATGRSAGLIVAWLRGG